MNINWNADRTATEWNELAAQLGQEQRRRSEQARESFERCDTDGFLSQWADQLGSAEAGCGIQLAENGGYTVTKVLLDAETGEIASTHAKWGDWGPYWVLNDAAANKAGKRFVNESQAQKLSTFQANMRKKGYTVGTAEVRGEVKIVGGGMGLAGAANCRAAIVPIVARLKDNDVRVIDRQRPPYRFEN